MLPDRRAVLLAAIAVAFPSALTAQAPDCNGISDVSDFDGAAVSDFDGLLTAVPITHDVPAPLFVASPPGDVHRLFVVSQYGTIRILEDGALLPAPFLDLRSIVRSYANGGEFEQGLLGLAFHPDYATNGWFFVHYNDGSGLFDVVARYTRDALNPDLADPASARVVITFPYPKAMHHFGGMLAFSPLDRHLYISTGDGNDPCDPADNAQSLDSNLGKILRLDVSTLPYSTENNPYDGSIPGNDEIWAYGLRNPWRFSFDRATGAMYIGDVGQTYAEEIDCATPASPGAVNYGWHVYEGSSCPSPYCGPLGSCSLDVTLPVQEFHHDDPPGACAVTGGYVYRGCRMKDLRGTYFYADFCSTLLRTFRTDASCAVASPLERVGNLVSQTGGPVQAVVSFGEDARGELYMTALFDGVYKIVPALHVMEVSGLGAPALLPGSPSWKWEDLHATSAYPISSYKVYRSLSRLGGFRCVHHGASPAWAGGDPAVPPLKSAFYYLVTAVGPAGEETRPGNRSSGVPRSVDTTSACPP